MRSREDILRIQGMWRDIESRVRSFFMEREFIEVRTPILTATPGMEPNLDPFETTLKTVNPASEHHAGLITSPEYAMKKLLGSGLEKIFTITPAFRNVEAIGPRNLPEFMLLEWYAPGNYEDLMQETEDLLNHVLESQREWPRIRYDEAHIKDGEPQIDARRAFITHYPKSEAALARVQDGYAERFEAFANGLELCNGFCELTDPIEQRKRFEEETKEREAAGKTVFPIDEHLLQALENIKTPIYGNALGLDRLLMLKYDIADIRDIQLLDPSENLIA